MQIKHIIKGVLIFGALELGILGSSGYDVISHIFGGDQAIGTRLVFILIGLAGVLALLSFFGYGCHCKSDCHCKDDRNNHNGHGGGCCK